MQTLANYAPLGIIFGTLFVAIGAYQLWRGWTTNAWRPMPAEITSTFVYETEFQADDDADPRSYYQPRVMYKYSVRGTEYECDRLQEGLFWIPLRFIAKWRTDDYRVGQRVIAYVSPRDPARAVLKRGPPVDAWLLLAGGVILFGLGCKFAT